MEKTLIVSPDESRGYLGFSTVTPPPPPQRFPFRRNNLKNNLVRTFKFGMWVDMGNATNATNLQSQGHWWSLKGQILAIFSLFGPVLIYRKSDHPMAGIYTVEPQLSEPHGRHTIRPDN